MKMFGLGYNARGKFAGERAAGQVKSLMAKRR